MASKEKRAYQTEEMIASAIHELGIECWVRCVYNDHGYSAQVVCIMGGTDQNERVAKIRTVFPYEDERNHLKVYAPGTNRTRVQLTKNYYTYRGVKPMDQVPHA